MKKFLYLILLLFFISCSVNKPKISSLSYKRVVVELDNGNITERLSIFLRFSDEDGTNDYESMSLTQKKMRLYWHITRSLTSFFKSDYDDKNSFMVGTNKIAHPLGKIPLGDYELEVYDMQGNKVVRLFSINEASTLSKIKASLKIDDNKWKVKVENEELYTRFYLLLLGADRQPVFLKTLSLGKNENMEDSIENLKRDWPNTRYLQLCAENASKTQGYLARPVELK